MTSEILQPSDTLNFNSGEPRCTFSKGVREEGLRKSFPINALFRLLTYRSNAYRPNYPIRVMGVLYGTMRARNYSNKGNVGFNFILFHPLYVRRISNRLRVLGNAIPTPPYGCQIFLFGVENNRYTAKDNFRVIHEYVSYFYLRIIFIAASVLYPGTSGRSTRSMTIARTNARGPIRSPTYLFRRTFMRSAIFTLCNANRFRRNSTQFNYVSHSLDRINYVIPSSNGTRTPSIKVVNRCVLVTFLVGTKLIRATAFKGRRIRHIPNNERMNVVSSKREL